MKRLRVSLIVACIAGLVAVLQFPPNVFAGEIMARGTFKGESGHSTTGNVSIVKTSGGYQIVLENNFSLDGAPDPYVALGGNSVKNSGLIAVLGNNAGRQVYNVPAGVDPAQFAKVHIWCKKFGVSLGSATLSN